MSIRVMTAVWDSGLYEGNALLLLLAMADVAADDGGDIWKSIDNLARKARVSRATVQRLQRALEADGVLVAEGGEGGGRGVTRRWRIDLDRLKALAAAKTAPETASPVMPFEPEKGSHGEALSGERVAPATQKGLTAMTPDSSRLIHQQQPCARAREELEAEDVVRLFDDVRVELFGDKQARREPKPGDLAIAQTWLELGAEAELLKAVFRKRQKKRLAKGKTPLDTLAILDGAVRDALADRRAPTAMAPPEAQRHYGIADTMLRPATPEELEAYRRRYPGARDAKEAPGWWLDAYRAGRFR